jgi:hypothetical protein
MDYQDWTWFDDLAGMSQARGFDSPGVRSAISAGHERRALSADLRERLLQRVRERLSRTGVLAISDFTALHGYGLTQEAFELIDQSSFDYMFDPDGGSPNGAAGPSMMFNDTEAGPMMRDTRFVGLCAKLGLCAYWVETGRWPDCADLVDYDFRAEARRLAS